MVKVVFFYSRTADLEAAQCNNRLVCFLMDATQKFSHAWHAKFDARDTLVDAHRLIRCT